VVAEGVYVYGIVRAKQSLPTGAHGVGSPPLPLRVLTQGRIGAVVSDAPPTLRARRRDLMAHQEILLALVEGGPVLPMRFGMVAPDEATVRGQLAAATVCHLAILERLSGRVEMNVKALPAQDGLAALLREDARVRQLRGDAVRRPGYEANLRLGEAVAAALSRRAAEAGRRLIGELTPLARAVSTGPQVAGCEVNVSFLVDRGLVDRFRMAARDGAEARRDRVEVRVAGPLPCYSFVAPEGALVGAER
jgi:gas vesicle protein GvpL/GvpF